MEQYISKAAVKTEINNWIKDARHRYTLSKVQFSLSDIIESLENLLSFLDTLEVKEVNIASMADEYYDALMKEAADWMDEGTMGHCRLAYYTGCKDVLNKIQKGE